MLPLPKFGFYAVGRLYNLGGDAHTSQFEGANGPPPSSKLGGCCRGVFAIRVVTEPLFQLEGDKARPRTQSWGGQSRSVYAIRAVTLTLPQLEGAQGRPRARSWGGMLQERFCSLEADNHTNPICRRNRVPPLSKLGGRCRGIFRNPGGDTPTTPVGRR